ncbi:hypothetical protein H6G97_42745 [Nostoc flagelliforme FACHB-838]|uniref:Uncharacterized protein n=1 Tax=Nostoc flagelliforme FACHB-838 TaxID=2692904 RepID=A0ABR8E562_9NOSO|nr:hypothetical protein [Nostoc flagelliforme]MBD2535723.1 hypothetical protein [Nostoc flagelliforme FACHB-838]
MARLITANPLYIRLLGVGCGVWLSGCSESEIYLYPHLYLLFLIFPEPATLPPTPSPDELSAFQACHSGKDAPGAGGQGRTVENSPN